MLLAIYKKKMEVQEREAKKAALAAEGTVSYNVGTDC